MIAWRHLLHSAPVHCCFGDLSESAPCLDSARESCSSCVRPGRLLPALPRPLAAFFCFLRSPRIEMVSFSDAEKQDLARLDQASPDLTNSGQQSVDSQLDYTPEEERAITRKGACALSVHLGRRSRLTLAPRSGPVPPARPHVPLPPQLPRSYQRYVSSSPLPYQVASCVGGRTLLTSSTISPAPSQLDLLPPFLPPSSSSPHIVGLARTQGLLKDIGLANKPEAFNTALALFFVGYVVAEVPLQMMCALLSFS